MTKSVQDYEMLDYFDQEPAVNNSNGKNQYYVAQIDSCGAKFKPSEKKILTTDDIRQLEGTVNTGPVQTRSRSQQAAEGFSAPTVGFVTADRDDGVIAIVNDHECLPLKVLIVFGGRMGMDFNNDNRAQNISSNINMAQRLYLNYSDTASGVAISSNNTRDIVHTYKDASLNSNSYYSQQGFETALLPAGQTLTLDRETLINNPNGAGEDPTFYVWDQPAIRVMSSWV